MLTLPRIVDPIFQESESRVIKVLCVLCWHIRGPEAIMQPSVYKMQSSDLIVPPIDLYSMYGRSRAY